MENNLGPQNEMSGQPQPESKIDGVIGKAGALLKQLAGKLPPIMFPRLAPEALPTWTLAGIGVAAFSLLLSFIPGVGGAAWLFGLGAIYVALLATRLEATDDKKSCTMIVVGVLVAILAILVSFAKMAPDDSSDESFGESIDRIDREFNRDMDRIEREFDSDMDRLGRDIDRSFNF